MSNGKVLFEFGVGEDEKLVQMVSKFPYIYDLSSPLYKDFTLKEIAWKETAEFVDRSVEDCKKRWRNIKDTYYKRQKKRKSIARSPFSKRKKWPLADMLTFLNKLDHKPESLCKIKIEETFSVEEDSETNKTEGAETPPPSSTKNTFSLNEEPPSFKPPSKKPQQTEEVSSSILSSKKARLTEKIPPAILPSKMARQNDIPFKLLDSQRIERKTNIDTLVQDRRDDDDVDLFFKSIAYSVKKLSPSLVNEAKMRSLQMVIELENRSSFALEFSQGPSASPSIYSQSTSSTPSNVDNKTIVEVDYTPFSNMHTDESL